MAQPTPPESVMLILPLFSRYTEALAWAKREAVAKWGEVALESEQFQFAETGYYEPQMGAELMLQMIAFKTLINPDDLIDIKLKTNALEVAYLEQSTHTEVRPLNLDPGYLTPAKFLLATTKDATHRVYLGKGIYAEVTLGFMHGKWQDYYYTYPNYKREDYKAFLSRCRKMYLDQRV
ncbi:DUF4416 family protein [Oligoflexia bacterium]|nr:DUF4416 family protein [Oligoflexia bacterium]